MTIGRRTRFPRPNVMREHDLGATAAEAKHSARGLRSSPAGAATIASAPGGGMAFFLYLVLIVSWFGRLTSRLPALGLVRFDLVLVLAIAVLVVLRVRSTADKPPFTGAGRWLAALFVYIVVTIPFVEWPGSVLNENLQAYIKVIVFYWFTVALITTEKRLATFLFVYIACQTFRILEPMYLNVTEGYWGSDASMADWEFMDRLAGAPHDVVNPNGLAFLVVAVIPFYHFLSSLSRAVRLAYWALLPVFLWVLMLTGSRSGLVTLFVTVLGLFWKSRRKFLLLLVTVSAVVIILPFLGSNLRDRYLSIVNPNTKNAATATGRLDGLKVDLGLVLRRPLFGHGVGTSGEAKSNFTAEGRMAHNLYLEVGQELGLCGLVLFLGYIVAVVRGSLAASRRLRAEQSRPTVAWGALHALQVWLWMNLIFSLASYGLNEPQWYLFGGLSEAVVRIVETSLARRA